MVSQYAASFMLFLLLWGDMEEKTHMYILVFGLILAHSLSLKSSVYVLLHK